VQSGLHALPAWSWWPPAVSVHVLSVRTPLWR
jgi:hypothetical protein